MGIFINIAKKFMVILGLNHHIKQSMTQSKIKTGYQAVKRAKNNIATKTIKRKKISKKFGKNKKSKKRIKKRARLKLAA